MPKNLRKNKSKRARSIVSKKVSNRGQSKARKSKKSFIENKLVRFLIGFVSVVFLLFLSLYFVLLLVFSSDREIKNILIVSNDLDDHSNYISLVHLSSNREDIFMISFDGDQMVNINDEYGDYSLGTIYQLLKIDKKTDGKIKSVFSDVFNIAIDDVVVINGINDETSESRELRKIFVRNLKNINVLKLYLLADSIKVVHLDKLSDIDGSYHKLSTIEGEAYRNCSVSVVNTTSKRALAKKLGEIIENTGAQVVQVEGSSSAIKETTIYYPIEKLECKELIDKILGVFPVVPLLKSNEEIPSTEQFRSSVVIMIGENY